MKSVRVWIGSIVALFLVALLVAPASFGAPQQDKEKPAGGGAGSMDKMSQEDMQKMMQLASPGPEHEGLAKMVGTWKTSIKMWMGPGEPQVSEGTATYSMILGGRYLQSKQTSTMGGMPFEGMGIDGYDNAQKQYVSTWIDNMGTGVMMMTGQKTADGKGLDYSGSMFDPSQGKNIPVREEIRWTGDSDYTFSMFSQMPGPDGKPQDMKVMEITAHKM